MFKGLLTAIEYRYKRKFKSNIPTFLSAIDLMQPINGVFSATQATVVTRMLDIERILQGDESCWDVRLACLRHNFSEEEKESFKKQSKDLVISFDKFGWDYNLSAISVNISPFYAYNGTHRLAYSLIKNPLQMVPICMDFDGWDWSLQDGLDFLRNNGLSESEIDIIHNKYLKLLNNNGYDYQILIDEKEYKKFRDILIKTINEKGTFIGEKRCIANIIKIPNWFSKRDRKFFKKIRNNTFFVIRFRTLDKDISYSGGEFKSPAIEEFVRKSGVSLFTYTPTITKSIELDIWLGDTYN